MMPVGPPNCTWQAEPSSAGAWGTNSHFEFALHDADVLSAAQVAAVTVFATHLNDGTKGASVTCESARTQVSDDLQHEHGSHEQPAQPLDNTDSFACGHGLLTGLTKQRGQIANEGFARASRFEVCGIARHSQQLPGVGSVRKKPGLHGIQRTVAHFGAGGAFTGWHTLSTES